MSIEAFQIEYHKDFEKEFERLAVKKKFKKLPDQIIEIVSEFEHGKFSGDKIAHSDFPIPHDVYKMRLPNPDANVGKSNGYRVIYMVVMETKTVIIFIIYYKKEQPTVSDTYINGLIDGYFLNSLPEEELNQDDRNGE